MLCVVPQAAQANASSPGCPLFGAISATFRIARPHRLQTVCTAVFNILVPLQDKALCALDGGLAQSNGVAFPTQRKLNDALGNQFGRWVSPVNKVQVL